jgi:hypothetical protein
MFSGVPMHKAHVHFYDYIESFPGAPEFKMEEIGQNITTSLRNELISENFENSK